MTNANSDETARAVEIATNIVKVQGNIFIKELLRQKKRDDPTIRIGLTKDDILSNLITAIKQGKLLGSDLDAWVSEVEGWGKQHVYLYRTSMSLVADKAWASPDALLSRLTRSGLAAAWNHGTSLDFPKELTVASASYSNGQFEMIWHKRAEYWNRDQEKDKKPNREVIDGDVYEFRAYRQELNRAVTRFVLIPDDHKAALFLQSPLADASHKAARDTVQAALTKIFSWDELKPVSISKVIKAFDKLELDSEEQNQDALVRAQNTKFAAKGATVEFDVSPGNDTWKNVAAVRRVRRALDETSFIGDSARFNVELRSGRGMGRNVLMSLSGKDKRVYLHSQMTADEVWIILGQVFKHST